MSVRSPVAELRDLTAASTDALIRCLNALIRAHADGTDTTVPRSRLQRLLGQVLAFSNVLGRRRVVLEAEASLGRSIRASLACADALQFADRVAPMVPRVEFEEAIADILARYPTLAPGYEAVQRVYAEGHAFALAKSTDEVVTRRVQKLIEQNLRAGKGATSGAKAVAELGDWTQGYSETVYQTNAATAYNAGVVAQAQDPDIAPEFPAFELIGRKGEPSRDNHAAAVGLIAGTKDPIWDTFAPPLGYNCTHGLTLVSRVTLKRRGLLAADGSVIRYLPPDFANAHPDPGFGQGSLSRRLAMAF